VILPSALIHKAALALDMRGDVPRALQILQQAIEVSDHTSQVLSGIEARVFLLDLQAEYGNLGLDRETLISQVRVMASSFEGEPDLIQPFLLRLNELS
jgi:hypothetical protein